MKFILSNSLLSIIFKFFWKIFQPLDLYKDFLASSSYLSDNRDNTQKLQKYHDFPAKVGNIVTNFSIIFFHLYQQITADLHHDNDIKSMILLHLIIYIGTIKIKSNSLTHNHLLN